MHCGTDRELRQLTEVVAVGNIIGKEETDLVQPHVVRWWQIKSQSRWDTETEVFKAVSLISTSLDYIKSSPSIVLLTGIKDPAKDMVVHPVNSEASKAVVIPETEYPVFENAAKAFLASGPTPDGSRIPSTWEERIGEWKQVNLRLSNQLIRAKKAFPGEQNYSSENDRRPSVPSKLSNAAQARCL